MQIVTTKKIHYHEEPGPLKALAATIPEGSILEVEKCARVDGIYYYNDGFGWFPATHTEPEQESLCEFCRDELEVHKTLNPQNPTCEGCACKEATALYLDELRGGI